MTLVEVEHVTKTFKRRRRQEPTVAVDDVSFELGASRTIAVVGESGAGKSTLGRIVTRLVDPDTGTVRLDGQELTSLGQRELRQVRRKFQMIFQDPFNSLDPRYTIARSVAEPLRLHGGMNRADAERRVSQILSRVGLGSHHLHKRPRELSGGQLARVAIARAIAVEPKLIVCDEPVAALDASIRAQVINLLLDLQESTGVSYVFVTHDLSTIRVFAHDILVMKDGKVLEYGATPKVFDTPTSPYTRELLDAVPVLDLGEDSAAGVADPH